MLKVFGDPVDARSLEQLRRCMEAGGSEDGVLCADHHVGYSMPIGGVIAYDGLVSPSGVGYDIACGNKAVRTELLAHEVRPELPRLADEISKRIAFGIGRRNADPVEHEVLDRIREAPFEGQRELAPLAANQLGTVGAGNHYVDLLYDEQLHVWVGCHFGSRGFGHQTMTGFLAAAQGLPFSPGERKRLGLKISEGEMDAAPTLLEIGSELGDSYVEAMQLAGDYAYAGRDVVISKVLEILGADLVLVDEQVHVHHNFAWLEDGRWVVRKGATPIRPGERSFIGGSMGYGAVIVEGLATVDAVEALHSTVHGAGRVMSRTQAAGKVKRTPYHACTNRNCEREGQRLEVRIAKGGERPRCEACGSRLTKLYESRVVREGAVDWPGVQARLLDQGVELRGAGADEAPEAYKDLDAVLAHHAGYTRVVHRLRPLAVVMAGPDVFDPYKD